MRSEKQEKLKSLIESYDNWFDSPQKMSDGQMTSKLYPYQKLFSPISINKLKIKNRIVMAPMGNINMCDNRGNPNDRMIAYFAERAKGGVGLITTGLVPVCFDIDPSVDDSDGFSTAPRINDIRTAFDGWLNLAEQVHAYGSRVFIQLGQGLGRVGSPACLVKKHKFPISSSWNRNFFIDAVPCARLSDRKCRKLIENTGQAAADARELSLDGVYLHGHEGYFLEQMTNPAFNRRTMGSFADWQAFGIKTIEAIRDRCGAAYPIMYRIDLSLALNEIYGDRMRTDRMLKKFTNERTIDMTLDYMKNLVKAGVDIFDVDLGCYDNWWLPHPPSAMPAGLFLSVAKIAKDYFKDNNILSNAGLPVPIVAVGKLGFPDLAEKSLRDEACDMVMLGRPLLADPEWANKAYSGKVSEIRPCIGDQEACLGGIFKGGHIQCSVNPQCSREYMNDFNPVAAAQKRKKIAVIGAGPAGVVCAVTASRRGHDVTLFEAGSKAGGALIAGSVPKTKFEVKNYVEYLNNELKNTSKQNKLNLKFKTNVTAATLKKAKFDAIVTCTGGTFTLPAIDGINSKNVVKATDLLLNPAKAKNSNDIVVIGGGVVGCETAHYLACEHGKKVTLVEILPELMKKSVHATRGQLIYALYKKNIPVLNCTRVIRIDDKSVSVSHNISKTVPDPYVSWKPALPENLKNPFAKKIKSEEKEEVLKADLVVVAVGVASNDSLYIQCMSSHAAQEIYNIGDSFCSGKVYEATKAGYALGISL